jgi:hypothetical protein
MATAKTGSFYLTATIKLDAGAASGTRVQGLIDTSSYVSVANGQALAIDQVDFIHQVGADYGSDASSMVAGNGSIGAQLTDLNPGTAFVRADNHSLIASSGLNIDQSNNVVTHSTDMYPDNFANSSGAAGLNDMFLVVNDALYLTAGVDNTSVNISVYVTARVRCRIVSLSPKNWTAIAIQATASQ